MKNRNSKLTIGLAVMFELILIVSGILSIASREWENLFLIMLAMICLFLPFVITQVVKKKNIVLPSSFQIITLLFIILAQYFGEIKKFYQIFWWWDLLLHGIFGSYAVIIALHLIRGIIRKDEGTSEERFALFAITFSICFSIALGTIWEIFEFSGDYLLKTNMVKGGLVDTATDLLVKISAASITSVIYYFRLLKT